MKTKKKKVSVNSRVRQTKGPRKNDSVHRKSINDRDLNQEEASTNASREEDWGVKNESNSVLPSDNSIEVEEDREAKRKIDDAQRDEWMN